VSGKDQAVEIEPEEVADSFAQEHEGRSGQERTADIARGESDEITYNGQKGEENHPNAISSDSVHPESESGLADSQEASYPLLFSEVPQGIARESAERISDSGNSHTEPSIGIGGENDGTEERFGGERQDGGSEKRADKESQVSENSQTFQHDSVLPSPKKMKPTER
jgi:hypothetical protein